MGGYLLSGPSSGGEKPHIILAGMETCPSKDLSLFWGCAIPEQQRVAAPGLRNECGRKGLDLTPPPGAHRGCSQMERGWRGSQLGLGLLERWMGTICCISIRARASRLDGCQRCHPVRQSWFQTRPSLQTKQMGALTLPHHPPPDPGTNRASCPLVRCQQEISAPSGIWFARGEAGEGPPGATRGEGCSGSWGG